MSVDGAATFVSQVAGGFQLLVFPSWRGQARLSGPGAMGRITNVKALVTPAPKGSRDATGGEMRDATMLYLAIKKELGKNAHFGKCLLVRKSRSFVYFDYPRKG